VTPIRGAEASAGLRLAATNGAAAVFFKEGNSMTTTNPLSERRQRSAGIDFKVRASGLHAVKIGDTVSQILFTDVADAVTFAQRFVPARGVQRVSIVPVIVCEKEFRR
jgi:hypothetical protein